MKKMLKLTHLLPLLLTLSALVSNAFAADPGLPFPASSEISDQQSGAVLFYPIYTSSATSPSTQNTRINITNICLETVYVHLFFVDGATCSVADSFICLTGNQTASFLASDIDPGVTGYIVAVAVDRFGCPADTTCLIGSSSAKLFGLLYDDSTLAARPSRAVPNILPSCDSNSVTAALVFDGNDYTKLPLTLAVSNIPSRADGNNTRLLIRA